MIKTVWRFFFPLRDKHGETQPMQTRSDLIWVLIDGEWREVCEFCHGNCGQCGLTSRVGNIPASMDAMVKNGNWNSGKHSGLP